MFLFQITRSARDVRTRRKKRSLLELWGGNEDMKVSAIVDQLVSKPHSMSVLKD